MAETEKKTKVKSKEYPAVTLNQAIDFINKLKEYPMGKPISYDIAAKTVGVSTSTKSFKYTISAAKQFGLISTSAGNTLSFLEPAKKIVYPTGDESIIVALKLQCFCNPKLYMDLIKEYQGKSLPPQNILENLLVSAYGIAPNAKSVAAKTFIDTANEVGAVQSGILNLNIEQNYNENSEPYETQSNVSLTSPVGEFATKSDEFDAPLTIPFGDTRKAILYMPIDATKDDAEYVQAMITLMFKKVYGVE
ncbi:MAG: hypothetical protein AB9844_05505 [Clostridiaceae bacterium]